MAAMFDMTRRVTMNKKDSGAPPTEANWKEELNEEMEEEEPETEQINAQQMSKKKSSTRRAGPVVSLLFLTGLSRIIASQISSSKTALTAATRYSLPCGRSSFLYFCTFA